jgi:hypothetical protein
MRGLEPRLLVYETSGLPVNRHRRMQAVGFEPTLSAFSGQNVYQLHQTSKMACGATPRSGRHQNVLGSWCVRDRFEEPGHSGQPRIRT